QFGPLPLRRAAEEADPRDRADRGEGLPPEAEGGDAEEVVGRGELARGMRGEGEGQFLGGNAVAVVGHAKELTAALFDVDPDFAGAGVEGVLDQLLDGAGGP